MRNEPPANVPIPSDPNQVDAAGSGAQNLPLEDQSEIHAARPSWREALRLGWERARKEQKTYPSRRELAQDRTKSLIVLLAVAAALLLVFFSLFSRPSWSPEAAHGTPGRRPGLGRNSTTSNLNDAGKRVTPMLSAETAASDPGPEGQVTAEDVNRTARTGSKPAHVNQARQRPDYALSGVDFSDPLAQKAGPALPSQVSEQVPVRTVEERDLKRNSLVFVRSTPIHASMKVPAFESDGEMLDLPPGTRLLARLEAPVSSAIPTPVVAVIEYNYERNGQIEIAAGAKVVGRVVQVTSSGDVSIQFSRLEMPDGSAEKLGASAMGLNFKPLRGYISGKRTGTKFLVRSLTGLGTLVSYLLGPQASGSAGLISTNVLLRERLADNVATAGQEELNGLAFNQNPVVTVPGNTRLYVVLEKRTSLAAAENNLGEQSADKDGRVNRPLPTLEELRQLIELRREMNELYSRDNSSPAPEYERQ